MLPHYSVEEERANIISHGLGAFLSLIGLAWLLHEADALGERVCWWSALVYGGSLTVVYVASTLYHASTDRTLRQRLMLLDHAAIFICIAGTYTPFVLLALPEPQGVRCCVAIWLAAFVGIAFKTTAYRLRKIDEWDGIAVVLYIAMAAVPIVFARPAAVIFSSDAGQLMLLGGALYLAGVLFYVNHRWPYNHAVWHVFVLLGSAVHYYAVLTEVLPLARA